MNNGFKTNLGAVLATIGSAVGLGNIWRFPYKMGMEGGSLFLLGYIFVSLAICLPLLISEFAIGRAGGKSNIKSIYELKPKSSWWLMGLLGILTSLMIVCFYNLIGGWISFYIFSNIQGEINSSETYFDTFISNPYKPIIFLVIFTILTAIVISRGIQKGIEKINLILLPAFALFLVGLTIYSFTLPNTAQSMKYIFIPDFSLLKKTTLIAILAQAFFSLSVGTGVMILYGSYMLKDANLVKNALQTTLLSAICFATISSIFIFNIIFAYGLDIEAGPKLLFVVLPKVFSEMQYGGIIAPIFFCLVFVAAFTSAISLFEVPVAALVEHFSLSRRLSVAIVGLIVVVFGSLCSLSISGHLQPYYYNSNSIVIVSIIMAIGSLVLYKPSIRYFKTVYNFDDQSSKKYSYLTILLFCGLVFSFFKFNVGRGFFDILDVTTEQIMIPLGGLLSAVFLSMVMDRKIVKSELSAGVESKPFNLYISLNKYVVPSVIVFIMLYTFI